MTAVERQRLDYRIDHVPHHEELERRLSELESLVMDHELCLKAHAEKIYPEPKRRSPVKPRTPRTSKKECPDDE